VLARDSENVGVLGEVPKQMTPMMIASCASEPQVPMTWRVRKSSSTWRGWAQAGMQGE